VGGYFFLGNKVNSEKCSITNGPMLYITMVTKSIVSLVVEADFGATFLMAK
jgi:hypothetical protein